MKNLPTAVTIALLAAVVVLLWRLERHAAPLAELARTQLVDRAEARREAREQAVAARQAAEAARLREETAAKEQAAAQEAAAARAQAEAARLARLAEPVKPGESVPEIVLENHEVIRDAVVVAVQASSVSFRAGARLYNIPTEQLPAELRSRIQRMYPVVEPAPGR